jgi:hypothetical protein
MSEPDVCIERTVILSGDRAVVFHSRPEVCTSLERPIFPEACFDFCQLLAKAGFKWKVIKAECGVMDSVENNRTAAALWHTDIRDAANDLVKVCLSEGHDPDKVLFKGKQFWYVECVKGHYSEARSYAAWINLAWRKLHQPLFPLADHVNTPGTPRVFNLTKKEVGLSRAVDELRWLLTDNGVLDGEPRMFHATSHGNAASLLAGGIQPVFGHPESDFGIGFYMHPTMLSALKWSYDCFQDAPALLVYRDVRVNEDPEAHLVFPGPCEEWEKMVQSHRALAAGAAGLGDMERDKSLDSIFGPRAKRRVHNTLLSGKNQLAIKSYREAGRWDKELLAVVFVAPYPWEVAVF